MACCSCVNGHAEQGGQPGDHGRVLAGDQPADLDDRLVDVADQDVAVAVLDLAARRRRVDQADAVVGGRGLGLGGVDDLQEPQPGEQGREQADHHHQQDRQADLRRRLLGASSA